MAIYRGPGGSGDATTDATNQASVASDAAAAALASQTAAATSATNASTSATSAASSASSASTSATNAASSASTASTQASNASTSATNAASSASSASTSATNAASSATSAATTYDDFDDRYLGSKSSAPSVDNDGNTLLVGALYWNSTNSTMYAWSGTTWTAISGGGSSGVSSFNTRTGAVTLSSSDVTTALTFTPPSTTGSGATGTWNIDILGSAGTVTNGVYTTGNQTIGGTKTFSSTISGSIDGNAATVTNGVVTTGSYSNPSWITSLAGSKISGSVASATNSDTVTNGIYTTGSYSNPSWITSLSETKVLPSQTGNSGKYLTTNGTSTSWATVTGGGASALDDLTDVVITTPSTGQVLKYNGTNWINDTDATGSGSFTYPGAGIAVSTGSAWGTSITDNSTNWNSAYTDRLKWDGGSTGLTASTGRTSLGATTVGSNLFTLTDPSAITFPRFNADNTVSALDASTFRTAIGAGTSSTNGTVTSVGLSVPTGFTVSNSPITSSGTLGLIFSAGYSLPTTTSQSNWDTAYGWGNHASAGYALASNIGVTIQAYDSNLSSFVSTFTLPTTDGTNGQVLTTNGSGTLSFTTVSGGSMVYPSGSGIAVVSGGTSWGTTLTAPSGTIVGTSDTQTLTNKTLTGTKETVYTITDGAAFEINPANGGIQIITLGANRTPKGTNFVAGQSVTLMIDDGTAYSITWTDTTFGASGIKWVGGAAPSLATTGYTIVTLWEVGTQVYGAYVGTVA